MMINNYYSSSAVQCNAVGQNAFSPLCFYKKFFHAAAACESASKVRRQFRTNTSHPLQKKDRELDASVADRLLMALAHACV